MKIAWITDAHLNVIRDEIQPIAIEAIGESFNEQGADCLMVTGDVSVGKHLITHLAMLEHVIDRPIYFVLGNHDFYGSSVVTTRKEMKDLSNMSQYLKYLVDVPYVTLSNKTALVGHDGWYDAGYGNTNETSFMMNDWTCIEEFRTVFMPLSRQSNEKIVQVARQLAFDAAKHVFDGIKAALHYHKTILIATHVPPFVEAHVNNGRSGDVGAQPWYTSKIMGEMLRDAARQNPHVRFEVFTGHTHGQCYIQVADNLYCHVGGASYGNPQLQRTIEVP